MAPGARIERLLWSIYDGPFTRRFQIVLTALGLMFWAGFTFAYLWVGSDLVQDYVAAKMLLQGRAIYGEGITAYAQNRLGISGIENFHPPFNAIVYLPLALIPWPLAPVAMNILSLIAWLLLVRAAAEETGLSRLATRWLIPAALLWHPFIATIGLVQLSVLLAAGVYAAWRCLKHGRNAAAGFFLAVLVQVKMFPVLLVFYPLLKRDLRTLAWTAIFSLIFLGVMLMSMGGDTVLQYVFEVMPSNIRAWVPFPVNYSLQGLLAQFLSPNGWVSNASLLSLESLSRFSTVLLAFLAFLVIIRSHALIRAGLDGRAFASLTAAALVFSPICWQHYFSLLAPGMLIASRLVINRRSKTLRWLWLLLIAGLFIPDVRLVDLMVELFQPLKIPAIAFALTRFPAVFLWTHLLVLLACPAASKIESPKNFD